jgi:threonine dehydratase
MPHAVSIADIDEAAVRIAPFVRRTAMLPCPELERRSGRPVLAKCESMQRTGSFKIRGATNAVRRLDEAQAACGVVTHSSGNHALALATAAADRGIPAHVVMPTNASAVKRAAVERAGATVVSCGPTAAERESACAEVATRTGAFVVPPYDHPWTIAGQGTVGLEIAQDVPHAGTVIVPVGGGGLIGGIAIALRARRPDVRIVGAEPALADDAAESFRTGRRAPQRPPVSVADGLRAPLGELTFPILRDAVDAVVTVSEDAIVDAMRIAFEECRLVIEPSAAVGIAALLGGACGGDPDRPAVVVLCGGNADLAALPWLGSRSGMAHGR